MALTLTDAFLGPRDTARRLEDVNARWRSTVMLATPATIVLRLILRPVPPFDSQGFPKETAWLVIRRDGNVSALCPEPAAHRRWAHRNPGRYTGWPRHSLAGTLCLEYPWDPPALRWRWDDGLEALVHIVHRHLLFEEIWRRTGRWPVEDAPHGNSGSPHPILNPRTRRILRELP